MTNRFLSIHIVLLPFIYEYFELGSSYQPVLYSSLLLWLLLFVESMREHTNFPLHACFFRVIGHKNVIFCFLGRCPNSRERPIFLGKSLICSGENLRHLKKRFFAAKSKIMKFQTTMSHGLHRVNCGSIRSPR